MILFKMLPGVLVAFSFYYFYSKIFFQPPSIILRAVAFFFSLSAVGLAIFFEMFLETMFLVDNGWGQAFILSSLPEEIAKFSFIFLYFKLNKIEHSLDEGIFYGILFGLFFGLVENLFYTDNLDFWPMMVRSTTALPLHMLTGGILGAFVITYENSNKMNFPSIDLFRGFIIVYLLHGFYNLGVFQSFDYLYLLPPILFLGFIILEYEIMVSRNTLPKQVMDLIDLKWDDYRSIHQFKQYLDWIDLDQEQFSQKQISILKRPNKRTIFGSLFFLVLSILFLLYFILHPEMITKTFFGINFPEFLSIFIFYPFFIAVTLAFSGTLNPEYFRSKVLRVPIFVSLQISCATYSEMTVVFYISRKGFYIPLMQPNMFTDDIELDFWIAGRSISGVRGKVYWRDKSEKENSGALIKFIGIPWKLIFYWNYAVSKQRFKNLIKIPKIYIASNQ
ncbi:PrsW family glutamic-type intramembrane protease [Leptospira sp. GIMC2001]|uniref:PrsW family glutamic-type intramembrane protease n=1 Tax=Leptospira sp. GIMC2001 TaxID=1513297 RepID=UPI00234B44CA|nr:PrsW family glutamic-type intramembrane protease [Leptospira sp. GIMC2001]WCL47821.1 PrsW family glutamic-type intramembrane protease [Leptospira sp. GIMC2001]